jgi:hypothetical protein
MTEYPELFKSYMKFCKYRQEYNDMKVLDLSKLSFIYPTTLLPLLTFIKENNIRFKPPSDLSIRNYFDLISSGHYNYSTYLPMIPLPNDRTQITELSERCNRLTNNNIFGGECVFEYVVTELICNIYEHSEFTIGFIMAQRYPKLGFTELCILDNGITIAGSLRKSGYSYNNNEHSKAIYEVLFKGLSSKKDKGRGYGLSTSKNIFFNALHGEFLIISGHGAVFMDKDPVLIINLTRDNIFNGTLISVRVSNTPKSINLYDYVE